MYIAIRPEDFKARVPEGDHNIIPSIIKSVVFTGRYNDVRADIGGSNLAQAELDATRHVKKGEEVALYVLNTDTIVLPVEGDPFADRIQEIVEGAAAAD